MSEQISQRELRNDSGRIMRGLDEGRTFVVSRHGQAIGELRPLRRAHFVDGATVTAMFAGSAEIDLARLRADVDAIADQSVEPRV